MKWADKHSPKQFQSYGWKWQKWSKEQLKTSKGNTWSRGINSRLPYWTTLKTSLLYYWAQYKCNTQEKWETMVIWCKIWGDEQDALWDMWKWWIRTSHQHFVWQHFVCIDLFFLFHIWLYLSLYLLWLILWRHFPARSC